MKVITETELRDLYKKKAFDTFTLNYPEKLTPAALQFLTDRRIRVVNNREETAGCSPRRQGENGARHHVPIALMSEPEKGYVLMDRGETVEQKPEAYTHLKGKMLVPKNNKRIKLRGMVDSLEASFISTIIEVQGAGSKELAEDLILLFEYVKKIMRAEVLAEALDFIDFKGWSPDEIREYSHYPEKYFGVKHFTPDPKYGKVMAALNLLRTQVRQTEIAAVDAFYDEDKMTVDRQDIIVALNRMSSLVYILMCQYLSKS